MKRMFVVLVVSLSTIVFFAARNITFAADEKPIELRLSNFLSSIHDMNTTVFPGFAKKVEERTKGKVKISIYPSEALGKSKDHYDMVMHGIADMGMVIHSYTPGRFPLSSVMEFPFMVPTGKIASKVYWQLRSYLDREHQGVKVLTYWVPGPFYLQMSKKPVKTLEDIKGLRIRSPGPLQITVLKEMGASPINIPVPEVYEALQRGMADGMLFPFSGMVDFRFNEVTKYHTVANLAGLTMCLVMNQKTWDSLPPDIQKIIEECSGAQMAETAGASYDGSDAKGAEILKKEGREFYSLPPEEMKRWADRLNPVTEKWVADMEAKGLPGKKLYEEARQLLKQYSK